MTGPKWVGDCCERGYIPDLDHERAQGIMKIHATCTPPCPRAATAWQFLETHYAKAGDGTCGNSVRSAT